MVEYYRNSCGVLKLNFQSSFPLIQTTKKYVSGFSNAVFHSGYFFELHLIHPSSKLSVLSGGLSSKW